MISVEEAQALLNSYSPTLEADNVAIEDALGLVLATDVFSPMDMPPFPQSAMDGYALGKGPRVEGSEFKVVGESAAGSSRVFDLKQGECVRIFTGAPVPESAEAVVQQEWIERNGDLITLQKEVAERMHIRPQGEQMKTGDLALEKGVVITPAVVGFLSMLGLTQVEVYAKPKIAVLVTGNELITPGQALDHGQIYESNSAMLIAALQKEGIEAESVRIPDNLEMTVDAIERAFAENDMVILSGGISVGDHDHVGTALNQLGVEEVFYKVAQKPGKPIFFGTKNNKAVFALPGNPAASLSCFYVYVVPTLRQMIGHSFPELEKRPLILTEDYLKKGDRAVFLKAKTNGEHVSILSSQSSAMLNSFAIGNALVYFNGEETGATSGERVETYILP